MSNTARDIIELAGAKHLKLGVGMPHPSRGPRFDRANLSGRLTEISAAADSALLTAACNLLLDAQAAGETTAWITTGASCFYPPDAADLGLDLAALPIIRVPRTADIPRAADKLARSGAFGFIVCDLTSETPLGPGTKRQLPRVPPPLQSRLLGLARKHQITLLFLTHKRESDPSLSSLVSLRGTAERNHVDTHETKDLKSNKSRIPEERAVASVSKGARRTREEIRALRDAEQALLLSDTDFCCDSNFDRKSNQLEHKTQSGGEGVSPQGRGLFESNDVLNPMTMPEFRSPGGNEFERHKTQSGGEGVSPQGRGLFESNDVLNPMTMPEFRSPGGDTPSPERPTRPEFRVTLRVIKDKRHAPGWSEEEVYHGPPGLR